MIHGFHVLILAVTFIGAAILIPRAIAHDRRMAVLERLDDEELAACIEVDPDYIAKARKW